ncbi:fructose 1,6-bisphosphatase [Oceanihabitans sp. 2_MG-2023]|uniref:fructose 1,6-bisphosphatase n=1 Tax=Oceanihabitans sp. 2_MG-2023 TaxID=3062661 RepID=UPI0026E170D8|nr:fructose 1,6-bisphosphatase [Oceanihabitans sp. 2_MG-2023]MDO6596522.1 fructose 1,6-bisphosphatase [Oceanihabitans sp. 2_MG-2023]
MAKDKHENNNTSTQDSNVEASSKIDAIKQLIFGENMQAYEIEFEAVKKDILSKKQELENLMDDVRKELLQNIDNLSTDINIRITEIEDSFNDKADSLDDKKLDRKLFGDLLINLGEKISK